MKPSSRLRRASYAASVMVLLPAAVAALHAAPPAGPAVRPGDEPGVSARPDGESPQPRTIAGTLESRGERELTFRAAAGDLVYGSFNGHIEGAFAARVTGPSGTPVQELAPGLIGFVAPETGTYRARLESRGGTGRFQLMLSVAPRSAADEMAGRALLSPRLREQARALADGSVDTAAFWGEMEARGTPLVEPIGEDFLVTFLWRGRPETRGVKVTWSMFHVAPVIGLERLGGSDIWFRSFRMAPGTRFTYRIHPDPPAVEGPPMVRALALMAVGRADPLNRAAPSRGGPSGEMTAVALPPAAPASRWAVPDAAVPHGEVTSFEFESVVLGNSRRISVYTPPGYRPDCGPYRLLMLFDGGAYQTLIPVPTILDNLTAGGEIAPTVAVFIDNVSIEGRSGELYPNAAFTRFVAGELLARIRSDYAVTRDPREVVLGGFSLGGLAATHVAWRHPESFGGVLSQSGAFWWSDEAIRAGRGEPILTEGPILDPRIESFELPRMIAAGPASPLRFHLESGLYEGDLLTANRFLRDVLTAKGYTFTYREFPGGHDPTFWRDSFGDALVGLVGRDALPPARRCRSGGRTDASGPGEEARRRPR